MVNPPSSVQINEASRMQPAVELFVCGLCKFIVTPFPLECSGCNSLYCEECVRMQRSWSCTVQNCRSRIQPTKMHRSVQEVLELITFNCPGCNERKRYEAFFKHVKQCASIDQATLTSNEQIQKIVASNQNAVPVVQHNYSSLAGHIYILEKDTKYLLQYSRQTNRVGKMKLNYRVNNLEVQLPHNYQCVQVGDRPNVYLIGGGEYQQTPASMFQCHQLVFNRASNMWDCVKKANMAAPRHGHAACSFMGQYVVVTGSRKDVDFSSRKTEIFDIENNNWSMLPMMINGRHYHASCEFNNEWAYVFAGISNVSKRYIASIERVNVKQCLNNLNSLWAEVAVKNEFNLLQPIQARQGLGAAQLNGDTIVIMGGFGGKYFNESLALNAITGQCTKTRMQMPVNCFPFAVPTVSDGEASEIYTVDWSTYKMFRYKNDTWTTLLSLKEQN